MNTEFNPFFTPLGKIRNNGDSIIEYHVYPKVQWVVKSYGTVEEKWYFQVVDSNWCIKEYSLNERSIEQFKSEMEKQIVVEQQQKQFFSQINKPLVNANYVDFPKALAFTIIQHEYGITTEKSRMPILGTWGAGPCVIAALYDTKNKIAAVAHLDSTWDVKSLENMIRNFERESTVAHLYGGEQYSFDNCLDIIEVITNNGIKIENCALIEHSKGNASLAIDARNGRLYSHVKPSDLTPCENMGAKWEQLSKSVGRTPLRKAYDGLIDLNDINLINENMDFPVAQPLPSETSDIFDPSMINISYHLNTRYPTPTPSLSAKIMF